MDNTYVVKIDVEKKSIDILDIKTKFLTGQQIIEIIGCEQGFECYYDEYLDADVYVDANAYDTNVGAWTLPKYHQYVYNSAVLCDNVDSNGANPCLIMEQAINLKALLDLQIKWKDAN